MTRMSRAGAIGLLAALLLASASACSSDRSTERPGGSAPTSTTSPAGRATNDERVGKAKFSDLPAFEDVPWADDLKAEQDAFGATAKPKSVYGSYTIPPFDGKYTHVEDSERRTLTIPCASCPKRTIWFFGSSAAFGLGQRDEYTTASYLVREGAKAGYDLRVRNLAVPGTTRVDELAGLEAHLEQDGAKPDLVIFMDGFNDVLATFMYAGVRDGALLEPIRFRDSWVEEFLQKDPAPELTRSQVPVVAEHIASQYRATSKRMAALLDARGIPHAFVFQPDGFSSPVQAQGLALALNKVQSKVLPTSQLAKSSLAQLLIATVADLGTETFSLRAPAASLDVPVFADTTHFNETGAAFFAQAIFRDIEPQLG